MNSVFKIPLFLTLTAALFGCTEDPINDDSKLPPTPEGYVRVSIDTNVTENERVTSRATDTEEKAYDDANVWVLMFNATSTSDATPTTIMQAPIKTTKSAGKLYALLRATAQPVTLYVVTGLTSAMNSYLGTPANFIEGTTTYAQISTNAALQTITVTSSGVTAGGTNYFPMCTERMFYSTGTTTLTQITAQLKRIVAKIDVDASALNTADFTLESVRLVNGAQKGYVLPQPTLPTFSDATAVQYSQMNVTSSNRLFSLIYLYENNGTNNPTKVIVKGRYKGGVSGYYRMDLHRETPFGSGVYVPYDIERNKHYTINIAQIQNSGYGSLAEALANKPSNAQYTVTVTDPTSHDVVSNGEYYMGVSNSEFVVYGNGALSNLLAVTVTHNAPASVTTRSVTVSGGLTAVTTTLAAPDGTVKTTNVLVTLPTSFTTSSKGIITLKLGNLTKTITVARKAQLSAVGGVFTDFSDPTYVMGSVESAGTGNWLKLSDQPDGSNPTSTTNSNIVSPTGGLYFTTSDNMPTSSGSVRSDGRFFVSRQGDQGRIRVLATQGFINLNTPPANPLPRLYVGAFWRANQMGERLIRMQVDAENLGAWRAKVMDDADWIVLDTQQSSDPNIGWKAGANEALVADMNTADASYRLSSSATIVSGTAASTADYIYFRIGLKSTHAATTAAPARYARVVVTYNNNTKVQVLYLRQGEEADYLMRTNETNTSGSTLASRPSAKRFSPYNLTDPNMGAGGGAVATYNQLDAVGASVVKPSGFTQYPSQAGALFQWAGMSTPIDYRRRAYHPTNPNGGISGWLTLSFPTTFWNTLSATNETCPSGYRRPNDGTTSAVSSGDIAGSEYRQSLYLKPNAAKNIVGTLDNNIWGYYADGFFDRRAIQTSVGSNATAYAAVSNNTKDVAYVGRLFYNPATNASIFYPASGYRGSTDGRLIDAGDTGFYWSSSANNTDFGWLVRLGSSFVFQDAVSRYDGFSIRCVLE